MTTSMDRSELDRLASDFLPQMERIARQMTRKRRPLLDEAISAGLLGVAQASRTFDDAEGEDFDAYAATIVRHRIADMLKARHDDHFESLAFQHLASTLGAASPPDWSPGYTDWVESLARKLPRRHGELIRLHYLEAVAADLKSCARRMGLTLSRAAQIHAEALALLRESFGLSMRSTSRRTGTKRGQARADVVAAVRALVAEGVPVTIAAVAARAGVSVPHVGSMRVSLIASGDWPAVDGRARNGGSRDPKGYERLREARAAS